MGEKECSERAASAIQLGEEVNKQRQSCETLQAELAVASAKLQSERAACAQEVEELDAHALKGEEKRRAEACQRLTEEHKRQLAKVENVAKKVMQKEARKRQDHRRKIHDLVKRVDQLKREKATAIRVCEENRSAYEMQLAQLGLIAGSSVHGSYADLPMAMQIPRVVNDPTNCIVTSPHRELRARMERLEQRKDWLRKSADSVMEGRTSPTEATGSASRRDS